jgi:hypothetical protein
MHYEIKTRIERAGQKYIDRAIMRTVGEPKKLDSILATLFGKRIKKIEEVDYYERKVLQWK